MGDSGPEAPQVVVSVSDPAQLRSLARWLESGHGVSVRQVPGVPGEGEQGVTDVLTMLASSAGLVASIKVLPEFIRSRRSGFRITTTVKGQPFVLDTTNVDEVLPILERLLDA